MAISPSIPTSFVPRQQTPEPRRAASRANNIFFGVSFGLMMVCIAAAGATYAYNAYLLRALDTRGKALEAAQAAVDQTQVQNFIRLRDRLVSAQGLLQNHVTLSPFFDVVESLTLQNVQFVTLDVRVQGDKTAQVSVTGLAKNFNSLAAQSNAFATQKSIKRAIFSGITLDKATGAIGFKMDANLDQALVIGGPIGVIPAGSAVTVPVVPVVVPVPASTAPLTATTTP
jgi:hypothetical protein